MVVSFDIIITINIVIVGRRSGRSFYFRECGKRETWLVDNEILRIDSITLEYVNVKMGMKIHYTSYDAGFSELHGVSRFGQNHSFLHWGVYSL